MNCYRCGKERKLNDYSYKFYTINGRCICRECALKEQTQEYKVPNVLTFEGDEVFFNKDYMFAVKRLPYRDGWGNSSVSKTDRVIWLCKGRYFMGINNFECNGIKYFVRYDKEHEELICQPKGKERNSRHIMFDNDINFISSTIQDKPIKFELFMRGINETNR